MPAQGIAQAVSAPALPQPQGLQTTGGQAKAVRVFRRVYSISFPHTDRRGVIRPVDFTREQFSDVLLGRHVEAFRGTENGVEEIMVFRELHSDGKTHIYAAACANKPYGSAQILMGPQRGDDVFCAYHSTRVFWSAVVCGSVSSVHKYIDAIA